MDKSAQDRYWETGLFGLAAALPLSIAISNVFFLTMLSVWLLGARWTWRRWPPEWGVAEKLFVVFILISLVSAALGLNPSASLKEVGSDFNFALVILVMALVRQRPDMGRRALWVFFGAVVVSALFGLVQHAVGVDMTDHRGGDILECPAMLRGWPRGLLDFLTMIRGRVPGTRSHPLTYAEGLLFGWAVVVAHLVRKERVHWAWILPGWVIMLALLYSQSRGPWLAAACLWGVGMMRLRTPQVLVRFLVLSLPVLLLYHSPHLKARAEVLVNPSYASNNERIHMWRSGIRIWKQNPWFGIGPANVKRVARQYQTLRESFAGPWGHLHDTYVNLLAERGGLGLLAFLGWMGALGWRLWRRSRTAVAGSAMDCWGVAGSLGLLGFLVAGVTETTYNDAEIVLMLYFVVGTTTALFTPEGLSGDR